MTLEELRVFYFGNFVGLYDFLNSRLPNIPAELHFEVSAAFDHLMRAVNPEWEAAKEENISKAAGHLKRATFDAFKLLFKKHMNPLWIKLTKRRYMSIRNGEFVFEVNELWYEACDIVVKARGLERVTGKDDHAKWGAAFNEWKRLKEICDKLEEMDRSGEAKKARCRYYHTTVAVVITFVLTSLGQQIIGELWTAAKKLLFN